ncbi:MAG: hypothetical protein U9Q66_03740 [Patescibacteria group bacterium]|nr:hypothetical protein [Patescibacteria group bacterium]
MTGQGQIVQNTYNNIANAFTNAMATRRQNEKDKQQQLTNIIALGSDMEDRERKQATNKAIFDDMVKRGRIDRTNYDPKIDWSTQLTLDNNNTARAEKANLGYRKSATEEAVKDPFNYFKKKEALKNDTTIQGLITKLDDAGNKVPVNKDNTSFKVDNSKDASDITSDEYNSALTELTKALSKKLGNTDLGLPAVDETKVSAAAQSKYLTTAMQNKDVQKADTKEDLLDALTNVKNSNGLDNMPNITSKADNALLKDMLDMKSTNLDIEAAEDKVGKTRVQNSLNKFIKDAKFTPDMVNQTTIEGEGSKKVKQELRNSIFDTYVNNYVANRRDNGNATTSAEVLLENLKNAGAKQAFIKDNPDLANQLELASDNILEDSERSLLSTEKLEEFSDLFKPKKVEKKYTQKELDRNFANVLKDIAKEFPNQELTEAQRTNIGIKFRASNDIINSSLGMYTATTPTGTTIGSISEQKYLAQSKASKINVMSMLNLQIDPKTKNFKIQDDDYKAKNFIKKYYNSDINAFQQAFLIDPINMGKKVNTFMDKDHKNTYDKKGNLLLTGDNYPSWSKAMTDMFNKTVIRNEEGEEDEENASKFEQFLADEKVIAGFRDRGIPMGDFYEKVKADFEKRKGRMFVPSFWDNDMEDALEYIASQYGIDINL